MKLLRMARLALASAAYRGLRVQRAGQLLIDELGAEEEDVQMAAGMLIERAGGRPLVRQAIERGQHLPTALTILGDLGQAEDRSLVRSYLSHPEPRVARAAEMALEVMEARGLWGDDLDG